MRRFYNILVGVLFVRLNSLDDYGVSHGVPMWWLKGLKAEARVVSPKMQYGFYKILVDEAILQREKRLRQIFGDGDSVIDRYHY